MEERIRWEIETLTMSIKHKTRQRAGFALRREFVEIHSTGSEARGAVTEPKCGVCRGRQAYGQSQPRPSLYICRPPQHAVEGMGAALLSPPSR